MFVSFCKEKNFPQDSSDNYSSSHLEIDPKKTISSVCAAYCRNLTQPNFLQEVVDMLLSEFRLLFALCDRPPLLSVALCLVFNSGLKLMHCGRQRVRMKIEPIS